VYNEAIGFADFGCPSFVSIYLTVPTRTVFRGISTFNDLLIMKSNYIDLANTVRYGTALALTGYLIGRIVKNL
jgi:hypothetical protein